MTTKKPSYRSVFNRRLIFSKYIYLFLCKRLYASISTSQLYVAYSITGKSTDLLQPELWIYDNLETHRGQLV